MSINNWNFWNEVGAVLGIIATGVVAWFGGRKKERSDIENAASMAKQTDATTEGIRISNEGAAIGQWRELYTLVQGERERIELEFQAMRVEFQRVKKHHEKCEEMNKTIRAEMDVMRQTLTEKKDK